MLSLARSVVAWVISKNAMQKIITPVSSVAGHLLVTGNHRCKENQQSRQNTARFVMTFAANMLKQA